MANLTGQLIQAGRGVSFEYESSASCVLAVGAIDGNQRQVSSALFDGEPITKVAETTKRGRASWIECWYHDNTQSRNSELSIDFSGALTNELAIIIFDFDSRANIISTQANDQIVEIETREGILRFEWINLSTFTPPRYRGAHTRIPIRRQSIALFGALI